MPNRRADRLFEIIQTLRGGRLRTAEELADLFQTSTRTIYRDLDDLILSGVPIKGQRGKGYTLDALYFLPPLSLTNDEFEALRFGMQYVQANGDPKLQTAARELLVKIENVLPLNRRQTMAKPAISLYLTKQYPSHNERSILLDLRTAIQFSQVVEIRYENAENQQSTREVQPLMLEAWRETYTVTAWCRSRNNFRNFRVDRILRLSVTGETFESLPGQTYQDYLNQLNQND